MIKGIELIFALGIIVIMIVSIPGGLILTRFILWDILFQLNLSRANPYLAIFLFFLAFAGPIIVIASILGFLWYQLFKNSLQASTTKNGSELKKGNTRLFLYIIIIFAILLILWKFLSP